VAVEAVVWEGSGEAWPGTSWGAPVARRLRRLGWQVTVVPWGDPGILHRGRTEVLHVFGGGMEPVDSGSAAMSGRLTAVADALSAAESGSSTVVGICLGAQLIAAASSGLLPRPVAGCGEAGLTTVRGHGPRDLVVPTAHVAEVPPEFLAGSGVRHLWSNDVTTVQGFALGAGVVGVQFHPELSAREGRWAARSFRRTLDAAPVRAAAHAVDPDGALGAVLAAAGADRTVAALGDTALEAV
jgi:GMP synthase-like glutamine amidotransferase